VSALSDSKTILQDMLVGLVLLLSPFRLITAQDKWEARWTKAASHGSPGNR